MNFKTIKYKMISSFVLKTYKEEPLFKRSKFTLEMV